MSPLTDTIRQLLYGVPNTHAERAQTVREEIIQQVEQEQWNWADVEHSAKVAHRDLKAGNLPRMEDDIQRYIRGVCEQYQKRGYSLEDLRDGVDGVQARASAEQSI